MDYETFDRLGDKKSRNKIIAILSKEAQTFDELGKKTDLNRTSVFYHISQLEKEGMIVKRFIGRIAYVGITPEKR